MTATKKPSTVHVAIRGPAASPSAPPGYDSIRQSLEHDHFGSYVMINTDTSDYVVAPTTSEVHAKFIASFGDDAPGWCVRIGASVFANA